MLIYMFWFYFLFPKKEWILVVKSINLRVRPEFGSDSHKLWAFYRLSFLICGKWIGFLSLMLWAFRYDNSSSSPGRYLPDIHNTFGFVTIKNIYRHSPMSSLATSPQAGWGSLDWDCCSVAKLCPTLWDHMNCSKACFPVLHHLPESAQTHVHWVGDVIQPSHPLSPPSPPTLNLSQHQGLV